MTYTCAKVKLTTGKIPHDGCYKEKISEGYQREMCVCESSSGVYPPCNVAISNKVFYILTIICTLLNFIMNSGIKLF